jgi:hypothetical protein
VIHNVFDDLYEAVESLYDIRKIEEGAVLELGEYNFVMESFSEDIIKIRK